LLPFPSRRERFLPAFLAPKVQYFRAHTRYKNRIRSGFIALYRLQNKTIHVPEGVEKTRAKARGVKFGRPAALTPHQRREAMHRLANGEAQADVARSFNVSQATISRLAAPSPFEASVVAA
jgi:DNA invertase Pin-like site-specific DNA recombinase